MTLRFAWDWEPGSGVRLPELASTWCRLRIDLDDTPVTLVERRDGSGELRHGLDVPAYPLAEFLAINWWKLSAISHLPDEHGVRLVGAGGGFAWPDLTLRSDRGLIWVTLRQRDQAPEHIRFLRGSAGREDLPCGVWARTSLRCRRSTGHQPASLLRLARHAPRGRTPRPSLPAEPLTQAEAVLPADTVLAAVAEFIDGTVRRLEDDGVRGTLLQDEWAAIGQADHEERDYCLVAAAWGQDPYDTSPDMEKLLLGVGAEIGPGLLADLARAVSSESLGESTRWLRDASGALGSCPVGLPSLGAFDWSSTTGTKPWRIGYERARELRCLLEVKPTKTAPVERLLTVQQIQSHAPANIDALVKVEEASLGVVVGADVSVPAQRFAAARAIGRHSLTPRKQGLSLLTPAARSGYTERAERAFAAELLAPAQGIEEILRGDFSDAKVQQAADYFQVNPMLVQHQIENQVAA